MRGRVNRMLSMPGWVLAVVLALTIGCDGHAPHPQDVAFAEPLLLPRHADLRIERESPDVGISVFSYTVPRGMTQDAAVASLVHLYLRRGYR